MKACCQSCGRKPIDEDIGVSWTLVETTDTTRPCIRFYLCPQCNNIHAVEDILRVRMTAWTFHKLERTTHATEKRSK